ncbi:hypothetical protein CVS40_8308 [Lucilia cuprina]|nr:hypothetical protein CVS40_8308 [Lucilia cuprina]
MDKFLVKASAGANNVNELSSESDNENSEAKNNPKRKFRAVWLDEFSWLRNKEGYGYCIVCEKKLKNHVSYFRKHASLRLHIQNVEQKKNQIKINSYCNIEKEHNTSLQTELTLAMFLVYHNLPFSLIDYLPNLLVECCPESKIAKAIKCGKTKATHLTDALGRNDRRVNKKSHVTWKNKTKNKIEIRNSDAQSLYEAVKDLFKDYGIPLENIIGLATDGANVMAGEVNGFQSKLKSDVDIFYIKCTCHSLHLCSAYACKKLPKEIEKLCRDIYNFFSHCPKRIDEFKEF